MLSLIFFIGLTKINIFVQKKANRTMKNFVEELQWRGMIKDIMPGTEEILIKEKVKAYIGFDPTAKSLHIGNLVQVMLLKHLQLCGHTPYIIIGGATGMIGDPSGKSAERNLLDEATLQYNVKEIKTQLQHFLDFDGPNSAVILNNYDWFKTFSLIDFLRDVGKHLTVNYMLAKESVKNRIETGISFTEFSYQLLQGYDFCHLYDKYNVKLQMGGADQWGNMTAGSELVRRKLGKDVYAITTPLLTKDDGTKFGKTETGNVWLDPTLTSPYQFYQFFMNCTDSDLPKLLRVLTLYTKSQIEEFEKAHQEAPHQRIMQKALAEELTCRVHSKNDFNMALKASNILFGKSTKEDLELLNENTLLQVFEGVPQTVLTREKLNDTEDISQLLSENTEGIIFSSRGEAKRMIKNGGVSINKIKIQDYQSKPEFELLNDKYLLVQRGKKQYFLIKVE